MWGLILVTGVFAFGAWAIYAMYAGVVWTWAGIGSLSVGGVAGFVVDAYSATSSWLYRGLAFQSWGGLLLLVGILAFIVVMIVNLVMTRGRTMVR